MRIHRRDSTLTAAVQYFFFVLHEIANFGHRPDATTGSPDLRIKHLTSPVDDS